ncbi:hypothetical protein BGZ60DRAFT_394117 [Tricladium varicosporioides]|nr:hypothetical protein BGZ60DRAFT_394117 [Hymenoscyphus varicosporioides]
MPSAFSALPSGENLDLSPQIYVATITTFVLATIAVPLRIYCRRLTSTALWWDDYFILIAYVFCIGVFGLNVNYVQQGIGRHIKAVYEANPSGPKDILKTVIPADVSYFISLSFTKFSILAFYWRLFQASRLRVGIYAVGITVIVWCFASIIAVSLTCVPFKAFWDPAVVGRCIDIGKYYFATSVPNVVTDFVLLLMPLPHLVKLKVSFWRKVVVLGLFCVGSFICIVSLLRLLAIREITKDTEYPDFTWTFSAVTTWSVVEVFCGIVCACLPLFRPLFRPLFLLLKGPPSDPKSGFNEVRTPKKTALDILWTREDEHESAEKGICTTTSAVVENNIESSANAISKNESGVVRRTSADVRPLPLGLGDLRVGGTFKQHDCSGEFTIVNTGDGSLRA